jgi:flagellar hook-associated protein 2
MRRTLLAIPLIALTLVAAVSTRAAAQDKTARGTVSAMSANKLTVSVAGTSMDFTVDDKTVVEARGGATAARKAQAANQAGAKLGDVIKTGQSVEVTYKEMGGALHASMVRSITASAAAPAAPSTSSTGKVTAVSATSITINGSGGGGSNFTQTFVISGTTKVVGKGAGTASEKAGGKVAATDLVKTGDTVHVEFKDMNGTLQANTITVTAKAAAK